MNHHWSHIKYFLTHTFSHLYSKTRIITHRCDDISQLDGIWNKINVNLTMIDCYLLSAVKQRRIQGLPGNLEFLSISWQKNYFRLLKDYVQIWFELGRLKGLRANLPNVSTIFGRSSCRNWPTVWGKVGTVLFWLHHRFLSIWPFVVRPI